VNLRIGIDARAAAEVPAGKGRYVRELLRALARRDDPYAYVLYAREPWDQPLDERFSWRLFGLPDAVWHARAALDAGGRCDVFLATASYLTPWFLRIPTVLVVHDLIAFQEGIEANRRAALIERLTIRRALRRAAMVVCDSGSTRRDLVDLFPRAEPKATVVQLAASEIFGTAPTREALEQVRREHDLDRPFVLCAGTLEPRKNLVRVLDAFARLPERLRGEHLLVIVGPAGWEYDEILARAAGLGDQVRLSGHVPDADLAALYHLCEVFCYPSLYEGFGLPLLEAMASSAPAITSNVSSLPEVGGDAVRYVDPSSTEEIAGALEELLRSDEIRRAFAERGRERAALFSWDRAAAELVAQFGALLSSKRS
jgi:glycosyltransferase involved in cell wall biosynthesis